MDPNTILNADELDYMDEEDISAFDAIDELDESDLDEAIESSLNTSYDDFDFDKKKKKARRAKKIKKAKKIRAARGVKGGCPGTLATRVPGEVLAAGLASDLPEIRPAVKWLGGLFQAGSVTGSTDRTSRCWVRSGAVYLAASAKFDAFLSTLRTNIQGASDKSIRRAGKVAATNLVVSATSSDTAGFAALLISISTPAIYARPSGVDVSVAITGGTTLQVTLDPVPQRGGELFILQGIVLSVSDNAGRGTPSKGTAYTVTAVDGVTNPALVDAQSIMQVETINLRDF